MKNQRIAVALALLSVLLWSTVATAFKIALFGLSPFQLIFVACVVSLVLFLAVVLVAGKLKEFLSVGQGTLLHRITSYNVCYTKLLR